MRAKIFFILNLFLSASVLAQSTHEREVTQRLFSDSLLFFNTDLRNEVSGQYYDAISVNEASPAEDVSSAAATGIGLVSLALANAAGVLPDAKEKTLQTLSVILKPNYSRRHTEGWFRHWFAASDGADNSWSQADGYSTIDTAILAAGAILNANYFSDPKISELSEKLLLSVNWASAIENFESGRLIMNYNLESMAPQAVARPFNEYILVSCLGKIAESRQGQIGPMTRFWQKHFSDTVNLPKKTYNSSEGPISVLSDNPWIYLSSFTIQFAYYLCSDVSTHPEYVQFFKNAQRADQLWFKSQSVKRHHYWGNGAGEALNFKYEANAIHRNPDLIVSPAIIAGFMAEDASLVSDLVTIYDDQDCLYSRKGREFLWRCSLNQPEFKISRLQAIDFSTFIFGLATIQPQIGAEFFKKYAAGSP